MEAEPLQRRQTCGASLRIYGPIRSDKPALHLFNLFHRAVYFQLYYFHIFEAVIVNNLDRYIMRSGFRVLRHLTTPGNDLIKKNRF
jgi:hypothetical protein